MFDVLVLLEMCEIKNVIETEKCTYFNLDVIDEYANVWYLTYKYICKENNAI